MAGIVEIITAKRDGNTLSRQQISQLVDDYTNGRIPDYQASAFLMAAFCRGMNADETAAMTHSMLHSGLTLDFSDIPGPKIDKHSTGGVGDKISLLLAPIAAACGLNVPMITGRGLGLTGGTWDKLTTIPGFRANLTSAQLHRQLSEIGVVITGQIEEVAPADKVLYALRDVTATVDFIPFISASIMSKKLAEGLDGLVLDVKCGRGAFMKTEREARKLAESLVSIGLDFGIKTVALLTGMDVPLGRAVGNWIEVTEAVRCLQGEAEADVMDVTLALAGEMLHMGGCAGSAESGQELAREAVASGKAFAKFTAMVQAQGGNVQSIMNPALRMLEAPESVVYAPAKAEGYVSDIDARSIGWAATNMGVGRQVKEDVVDWDAGIYLHRRPGERVEPGMALASFYTHRSSRVREFHDAVLHAYRFQANPPVARPVVMDRLTAEGWQK